MTDVAKLRELLARVEAASGQDRDLDYAIHDVVMDGWLQRHGYERREDADGYRTNTPPFEGARYCSGPEAFTSSIDAAVALAERVLPKNHWGVERICEYPALANCRHHFVARAGNYGSPKRAEGATPALALLAAILRAKIAEMETPE